MNHDETVHFSSRIWTEICAPVEIGPSVSAANTVDLYLFVHLLIVWFVLANVHLFNFTGFHGDIYLFIYYVWYKYLCILFFISWNVRLPLWIFGEWECRSLRDIKRYKRNTNIDTQEKGLKIKRSIVLGSVVLAFWLTWSFLNEII